MTRSTRRKPATFVHGLLLLALSACVLGGCDDDGQVTCTYDGTVYVAGDSFAASDGCNSCSCESSGAVACTLMACAPAGCESFGQSYALGEQWVTSDGCTACTCEQDGEVVCDQELCTPEGCSYRGGVHEHGDSFPAADGCNSCSCDDGEVSCTKIECAAGCITDDECDKGYRCDAGACVYAPCQDKDCGDVCKMCDPTGDSCASAAVEMYCDAAGACVESEQGLGCTELPFCDTAECECGCEGETCLPCPNPEELCEPGELFDAADGCNSCSCPESGLKADATDCTEQDCGCMYEGEYYAGGESFGAADGCNTCICEAGEVACTEEACGCEYGDASYADGESFGAADGCNSCTCDGGVVTCTEFPCEPVECIDDEQCAAPGASCVDGTCIPWEPVGDFCEPGESFTAADGCNSCGCPESGLVVEAMCTKMLCAACDVDGEFVAAGENLPATDACNTCTCVHGEVLCTQDVCDAECSDQYACMEGQVCADGICVPDETQTCTPGESFEAADGCNTCTCPENGDASQAPCTLMACEPLSCTNSSQCGEGMFCDFDNDTCGVWGGAGQCKLVPDACGGGGQGACGCDGSWALNACELQLQGVDHNTYGGCASTDEGVYACGDKACALASEACHITTNDIFGEDEPEYFASCQPLTEGCSQGDCSCLSLDPWTSCYDGGGVTMVLHPGG